MISALVTETRRTSAAAFRESIERHARYSLAQSWETLSPRQVFECVSLAVRDLLIDRWLETERRCREADAKRLSYLSIEYLPGRLLTNNLSNLGILDLCRDTLSQMGLSLEVWPGDNGRRQRMSIIEEGGSRQVRMAHLSIVGSHSINGVSALHSRLVQTTLAPDFFALWPARFNNKTNGVTPRRWLLQANPLLAGLITRAIGDAWVTDLDRLRELEPCAGDAAFRQEFRAVKRANRERLARVILQTTSVTVDPDSLFDVHVKRIHEYKRQLLNVMRIVHEYLRLIEDGVQPAVPRTCVFAGKAAPGYRAAKQTIKLICNVGSIINNDPRANGLMKVAFVPDFRVSLAEVIVPGADLSEQISTAGSEASGTGNMKLAMNGALTIGTLDGATVEMLEAVGAENMFIFGLTEDQIKGLRDRAGYRPRDLYQRDRRVKRILDAFDSNLFSPKEPGLFHWVVESVLEHGDPYFHLADLAAYIEAQHRVDDLFEQPGAWAAKAILNVARTGRFSSDRTVTEYARDIWGIAGV